MKKQRPEIWSLPLTVVRIIPACMMINAHSVTIASTAPALALEIDAMELPSLSLSMISQENGLYPHQRTDVWAPSAMRILNVLLTALPSSYV
jgi:hypothetical protein